MAEPADQYVMINVNLMIVISKGYKHRRDGTKKSVSIPLRWWGRFSLGLHQRFCTQPCNRDDQRATTTAKLHWTSTQFGHKTLHLSNYHWQELPQVSFLLRQKFCCDKHVFVATNTCLWQQNTSFAATKVCLLWQIFVETRLCLLQQKFCCDKHMFVMTKVLLGPACFWRNKTKLLLWQNYVCHNKYLLWQKFCHNKHIFVATKLWQKTCFVATKDALCQDKHMFVVTNVFSTATKMLLLAAPANDIWQPTKMVTGQMTGNKRVDLCTLFTSGTDPWSRLCDTKEVLQATRKKIIPTPTLHWIKIRPRMLNQRKPNQRKTTQLNQKQISDLAFHAIFHRFSLFNSCLSVIL